MNTRYFLLMCLTTANLAGYQFTSYVIKVNKDTEKIALTFALKPGEHLYKESLVTSVNSPFIKLSQPVASVKPTPFFDETTKKERDGYKDTVTFTMTAKREKAPGGQQEPVTAARVHVQFALNNVAEPQEKDIPIQFEIERSTLQKQEAASTSAPVATQTAGSPGIIHAPACEPEQPSLLGTVIQRAVNWIHVTVASAKERATKLFTSAGSRAIRFSAGFILGLLLSLTPCIYPMIPITVGILQARGTRSAPRNFILALCYTLGISTTFALLGLLAAVGSCVFGELQGSPWIVIPIALLLFYFAFSLFDWVNFSVPQWMQPKTNKVKGGSLMSAYLFGALSGTIASPCLSPGLVLILHYVTSISVQSIVGYLEGFLLLFVFGIGSSLPLLIIGTFSTSLTVLPKAGAWMVEIKKIVGLMLVCMAFYQLSHLERLLPWYIFVWVIVLSFFALGVYYFATVHANDTKGMKRYKNIMGTVLIAAACLMMIQGQKAVVDHLFPHKSTVWLRDFAAAEKRALTERKLLFIDIGATYCSACKSLDTTIFSNNQIMDALSHFVQVKIDSDVDIHSYNLIKGVYGSSIAGFPTYLVVDPSTQKVLKKWSIDLEELSIAGIADALKQIRQQPENTLIS